MLNKSLKVLSITLMVAVMASVLSACGGSGIKIGAVTGTTYEEKAKEFSKVTEVKLYKDDNLTLQELASKRIDGKIIAEGKPDLFFENPQNTRAQTFLSRIL